MTYSRLFTSESVTAGHPDKVCDQISDAVLDAALTVDPLSRVAIETLATTNRVIVAGELTCASELNIDAIVRRTIERIGYVEPGTGFDANSVDVSVIVDRQSPDIAQSVERSYEAREEQSQDPHSNQGAGDQGLMFGYATNETPEYMPVSISLAHRLAKQLAHVRQTEMPELRPDGKTQVTVRIEGDAVTALDTVVVSSQHSEQITLDDIRQGITDLVIKPVLSEMPGAVDSSAATLLVNPSGRFVEGGPSADTGVTGRKIIVDTYGGVARHGGGAFSGKDASKVDRSASYALRWIAKNIVAAQLAEKCEIQASYAIGRAEPVGLWIETFGTATISEKLLHDAVRSVFDLRPSVITADLALTRPGFEPTAAYGHFGRDEFTWEQLNRVEELTAFLN
ncbi:MAG: methionine adenosyltransferase [Actinomycetaceae bacterium]|nr:methionine adenosyltransferase [Actinomycetaceae bacterium]